jgi:glutathione S-transferase
VEDEMAEAAAVLRKEGYAALDKLETWLIGRSWLVGGSYSIADLGVYPNIALASEGGYEMERYPSIKGWLVRVEDQPDWTSLL